MANHAATDLAQRLGEIVVGDVGDGHADMQAGGSPGSYPTLEGNALSMRDITYSIDLRSDMRRS